MNDVASLLEMIGFCVLLYAGMESYVHREMHRAGSYRFHDHAVRHHRDGALDDDASAFTQKDVASAFVKTLPIMLPVAIAWSGWLLVVWGAFLVWAGFAWTAVHRRIHHVAGYWFAWLLCPWYPLVAWNHRRHHVRPTIGFGGMFWFISEPPLALSRWLSADHGATKERTRCDS